MANLFLFGIGGTGARVIRSFVMLLAAGAKISNTDKIIPILIDPDTQNGDLMRTVDLLKTYKKIHDDSQLDIGFFSTPIDNLASLADSESGISKTFDLNLSETINYKFRDFLEYDRLGYENQLLVNLLYSNQNLDDTLTKGFLGNPNVGSVVLNKLKSTNDFKFFGTNFANGDRIFIINSIFGGTGAAGFPLLLKNFRNPELELGARNAIINSKIGACVLLPYFNLRDDSDSKIDSNNFISKTKAALSYYYSHLQGLNSLYYIADKPKKAYENNEGGDLQKNNAHIVELISALSIFNFMEYSDTELEPDNTLFHEYAIKDQNSKGFDAFGINTNNLFKEPLINFNFLRLLTIQHFDKKLNRQPWADEILLKNSFFESDFYHSFKLFMQKHFTNWLKELKENERSFAPLGIDVDISDMKNIVVNKPLKKQIFGRILGGNDGLSADHFDIEFNKIVGDINSDNIANRFLTLCWKGIESIYNNKYN